MPSVVEEDISKNNKLINKGKGAGGANTNKNGLSYEIIKDLSTEYEIIKKEKSYKIIKFNKHNIELIFTKDLSKCIKNINKNIINKKKLGHGCKRFDECYINQKDKIIFIIEKKFQKVAGSACEKIQTYEFKMWNLKKIYINYNIVYMYCLSDWFRNNCQTELDYLQEKKCEIFWGNNKNYKNDIINYITSYKLQVINY